MSKRCMANFHYFDKIDSPNKAYWLGFIWADGYIAKRERKMPNGNIGIEYNLKLSLMQNDAAHVEKFLKDIESNYPVNFYKTNGFNKDVEAIEATHLRNNRVDNSKTNKHKFYQRHKNKDGSWKTLSYSGKVQGMKILNYLYDSQIYLDRKYEKYLSIPYHNK